MFDRSAVAKRRELDFVPVATRRARRKMPTAPAQRCANVANENKWTYDENRVLLGAIEQFSNGKIVWDVVGKVSGRVLGLGWT